MNVVSSGPLRVASLVWQPRDGTFVLTVVAKATYRLAPGTSRLAEYQEEPNQEDRYWNDDLTRSLFAPADLVPYKPRADILLVGHAFAPRRKPVRSLMARLVVAGVDKTIEVHADRSLLPDGTMRDGPPFNKMPIRYERAAAGAANPVGIRPEARADQFGGVPLPNLQQPGLLPIRRGEAIMPVGFGPIAPTWPTRLVWLPTKASPLPSDWPQSPVPEGLNPRYFNAAPPDQQVDQLHADEEIVIENLHIQHSILHTRLPGLCPKAVVERAGPPEKLSMTADTLWIDTDSGLCTLTWRGQLRLDNPNAPGRIFVSMINMPKRELARSPLATMELPSPQITSDELKLTTPRVEDDTEPILEMLEIDLVPDPEEVTLRPTRIRGPALPFTAPPPGGAVNASLEQAPLPRPARTDDAAGTTIIGLFKSPSGPVLPFDQGGGTVVPPAQGDASSAAEKDSPQPPAMVHAALSTAPIAPADKKSLWTTGSSNAKTTSAPLSSVNIAAPTAPLNAQPKAHREPAAAAVSVAPAASTISSIGISSSAEGSPMAPKIGSVAALKSAGIGASRPPSSAAQASNEAAGPKDVPAKGAAVRSPSLSRAPIELLWFDRAFIDAIRKEPIFKSLLAERKAAVAPKADNKKPPGTSVSGDLDPREDIASICALGEPRSIEGLNAAMADAIDEKGMFSPPMVLINGDLEFPFDEVETLKATVTAITPLAAGDRKLKETTEAIEELLKTPWLQSAGSVTERLTTQLKEAFASGNRLLPPGYLEGHTERILLDQRHYQKRTLLGQVWIRALLAPAGSSSRIPAYLPHTLARELPMFQRFPVRLIAEARPQLDQYETCPMALRVVALVRVLGFAARP